MAAPQVHKLSILPKVKALRDRFQPIRSTTIEDHLVVRRSGVEELQDTVPHLVDEVCGLLAGVRVRVDICFEVFRDRVYLLLRVECGARVIKIVVA